MKHKRIFLPLALSLTLLLLTALLVGCAKKEPAPPDTKEPGISAEKPNDPGSIEEPKDPLSAEGSDDPGSAGDLDSSTSGSDEASVTMDAEIFKVYETSILVGRTDPNAGDFDLITLGTDDIPLSDPDGNAIGHEALASGMSVQITYNGMIMETYPAKIDASALHVTDTGTTDSIFNFYLDVLKKWYAEDPGLNGDISMMGFDLTEVKTLTELEKNALIYVMGSEYGFETVSGTWQELCDAGYIDRDNLYWEDGVHFTLKDDGLSKNGKNFHFSVTKWRSGLGAIGSDDCKARLKENGWEYEEGAMWIS